MMVVNWLMVLICAMIVGQALALHPQASELMMAKRFKSLLLNALVLVSVAVLAFPIVWIVMNSFKVAADVNTWPPVFLFDPTWGKLPGSVRSGRCRCNQLRHPEDRVPEARDQQRRDCRGCGRAVPDCGGCRRGMPSRGSISEARRDLAFFILGFRFAPVLLVVIPLFQMFQALGIYDSFIGMIWVYQLVTLPMIIWLSRSYVEDIPLEVEEAAAICGASKPRIMLQIVLPLLRPGLVGASLLVFLLAWHNFALGLILTAKKSPVTVGAPQAPEPGSEFLSRRFGRSRCIDDRAHHPDRDRPAPSRTRPDLRGLEVNRH